MNFNFYISIFLRMSLIKSVYYSLKFKFPILIARASIISINNSAKIYYKNKGRLYLGFNTVNNNGVILQLNQNATLFIDGSVNIFSNSKIVVMDNAYLKIGNGTFLNEGSRVQCRKRISIGQECSISWGCFIIDSDFHGIYIDNKITNIDIPVEINDRVWIGAKSTIQKGAKIHENVIIGSHSLVLKGEYRANSIYAGTPAKFISNNEKWGQL